MIRRAYYSNPVSDFLQEEPEKILGVLATYNEFALEESQRNAWQQEIVLLKQALVGVDSGYLLIEYSIPRMGKRADAILLADGLVFVVEFKVNETQYTRSALDQVMDYALDLKNFHQASHNVPIIPILVATNAPATENEIVTQADSVYEPLRANASTLATILEATRHRIQGQPFDPEQWVAAAYRPTPTIIEAAQALYKGHSVADISRSEASAINLTQTSDAILKIIRQSKAARQKAICFVTGVPGAGKTLAGLNIANSHLQVQDEEYAVFLSGNGPLVDVLREALARDDVETSKLKQKKRTKKDAQRDVRAFIQNVHHFRDEALTSAQALTGKIVVFDEAQRAWTLKQTASFMKQKKDLPNFEMSEPEFLISVMNRQPDWAVIVCLVGGGQEINTGEAGIGEWFSALGKSFPDWHVYISNQMTDAEYTQENKIADSLAPEQISYLPELHLGVSMRSFRSEKVSRLVKDLLDLNFEDARNLYRSVRADYPIVLTRDLAQAKARAKHMARGTQRYGLLASSGATRLRPAGIDIKSEIEVENWFLNDKEDVRASFALEQAATEFDIQGLELDWTIVAWDADLRIKDGIWEYRNFSGSSWQSVKDEQRRIYLKNAYRVLLTRARQGMVIFVPEGDNHDITRLKDFYDGTFKYLEQIGFEVI